MNTHDIKGRPWAKLSELKVGDAITVDGGFTCMDEGHLARVQADEEGLYIVCAEGRHDLRGQADDGEHCVGLYKL